MIKGRKYLTKRRVLDDLKIEVRYLSVTLLDFKESTENENKSRDKKYEDLVQYFNSSFEDLRAELFQTWFINNKTLIQNLEDSQEEIRRILTGIYLLESCDMEIKSVCV